MQEMDLLSPVTPILAQLGDTPRRISFLARGATCTVWHVHADKRSYALRIIEDPARVLSGALDDHLRKAVLANGGRVVAPLLNSESAGQTIHGQRWCLEDLAEGAHPVRAELSDQVCRHLGETLAALHQVPVARCGRPVAIEQDRMIGGRHDPFHGVRQRFENPLPETWPKDFQHPILNELADLEDCVMARLREVSERVWEGESVMCHSDLHERQLICADDTLVALIDFGDASILDRHWDLGSALYFHGERNFAAIHNAYSTGTNAGQSDPNLPRSFSIAIAMHHASRSRLPGKHHRFERAVRHVRRTIGSG